MSYISYSQLRMLSECPRKYYYSYVAEDAKKPLPSEAMAAGTAEHRVLADILAAGRFDELPKPFDKIVRRHVEAGWDMEVEKEFNIVVGTGELKCVIDLLLISPDRDECIIIDWKGRTRPDDSLQLEIYALAAYIVYGDALDRATCYYASYAGGFRAEPFQIFDFKILLKKVRRLVSDVMELGKDVCNYDINPGQQCYNCPFVSQCAAKVYSLPYLDASLDELIPIYYLASAHADAVKERIAGMMEQEGLVEYYANGSGFKRVVSTSYRESKQKKNGRGKADVS